MELEEFDILDGVAGKNGDSEDSFIFRGIPWALAAGVFIHVSIGKFNMIHPKVDGINLKLLRCVYEIHVHLVCQMLRGKEVSTPAVTDVHFLEE